MNVKLFAMGGGRSLLTHCKSSEFFKNFAKKISSRSRKYRHKNINSKGTVLIEFAVCIPIFVILLFYAHDLVKIRRYYSQTEFVGQQMVNILQNISQKRDNKSITNADLRFAVAASWLAFYPGNSMYYKNSGTQLIHRPYTIIYYVKGLSGGKASCIWRKNIYTDSSKATLPSGFPISTGTSAVGYSIVKFRSNVTPSEIYPSLKINEDEVKILIDNMQYWTKNFKNNEGNTVATAREVFGYHLLNPKTTSSTFMYTNTVSIFTPKPGLFDETGPQ